MKPQTLCVVAALAAWLAFTSPATGGDKVDKAVCVAAAESAQEMRHAHDLNAAREKLLSCSTPACPRVVAADCKRWLAEVNRNLDEERATRAAASDEPPKPDAPKASAPEPQGAAPQKGEATPSTPTDTEEARKSVPSAFWALSGVGAVAIGSFAYFGLTGRSSEDALVRSCAPHCASSDASGVRTKFAIADVSLAVGVVAIAAAAWIFVTRGPSKPTSREAFTIGRLRF